MRLVANTVVSGNCFEARLCFFFFLEKSAKLLRVILHSTCFQFILTDTVKKMS